jgi:hypothetical protein
MICILCFPYKGTGYWRDDPMSANRVDHTETQTAILCRSAGEFPKAKKLILKCFYFWKGFNNVKHEKISCDCENYFCLNRMLLPFRRRFTLRQLDNFVTFWEIKPRFIKNNEILPILMLIKTHDSEEFFWHLSLCCQLCVGLFRSDPTKKFHDQANWVNEPLLNHSERNTYSFS